MRHTYRCARHTVCTARAYRYCYCCSAYSTYPYAHASSSVRGVKGGIPQGIPYLPQSTGIKITYVYVTVFVAGWRHALRSEWPFIIIIIIRHGNYVNTTTNDNTNKFVVICGGIPHLLDWRWGWWGLRLRPAAWVPADALPRRYACVGLALSRCLGPSLTVQL